MIEPGVSLETMWGLIASNLRELVSPQQYRTWFYAMKLRSFKDNKYIFTVPNDFLRNWIANYYIHVLHDAVHRASGITPARTQYAEGTEGDAEGTEGKDGGDTTGSLGAVSLGAGALRKKAHLGDGACIRIETDPGRMMTEVNHPNGNDSISEILNAPGNRGAMDTQGEIGTHLRTADYTRMSGSKTHSRRFDPKDVFSLDKEGLDKTELEKTGDDQVGDNEIGDDPVGKADQVGKGDQTGKVKTIRSSEKEWPGERASGMTSSMDREKEPSSPSPRDTAPSTVDMPRTAGATDPTRPMSPKIIAPSEQEESMGAQESAGTPEGESSNTPDRTPIRPAPHRKDRFRRGEGRARSGFAHSPSTGTSMVIRVDEFFLNPNYVFHDFIVGPCNQLSYAASLAVADNMARAYNPLFLHGLNGLGKTHLLQAICHRLLGNDAEIKILFLSCETFINHFISAVEKGDLDSFRNKYRHIDILLIDDIHLLANKERTQEEFFHTFNALHTSGKQIVISSDTSPSEIPTLEERLVSRFKWGLVTEMYPPDYETRCAILMKKAKLKGRELPDDVITFLAENISTNIRELEGAVTKVIGYATLMNRNLDLDMAREAMKDVIKPDMRVVTIDHIVKAVTMRFNVKLSDLQSKKRTQVIALPRQTAMYIIKEMTNHSLQDIGAYFGGRDHTTVLHAHNKIAKKMEKDESFRNMIHELMVQIRKN